MASPINILFLLDCLYADAGGGSERQFLEFYRQAPNYGINIHICFLQHQPIHDKLHWHNKPVTLEIGSPYSLKAINKAKALSRYIEENDIVIVQTLFDNAGRFSTLLNFFLPKKTVTTIIGLRNSGHNHTGFLRFELKLAYNLANHFIVNAGFIKNYISRSFGIKPDNISVIKNTFEKKPLIENPEALALERKLRKDFKHIGIIVANLRPVKGINDLLQGIKILTETGPASVAFLLIGEGEQETQYRVMSKALGIDHCTFFLGRQENVASYLNISDFALLTSHAEGLSNALIEYVYAELPVIATDVGGNSEVIAHAVHGLITPSKSPTGIAESISILTQNLKRFKEKAISAKSTAETTHAPQTIYQATANLYQALIEAKNIK